MDLELFSVGAGQFVSLEARLVTAHDSVPESSTPALMMVGPVLLVLRSRGPWRLWRRDCSLRGNLQHSAEASQRGL